MTKIEETPEQIEKRFMLEAETVQVADAISDLLPPDCSFMLVFAGKGEGYTRLSYAGNAKRESAIEMMRELLERWGANQ